MTRYVGYSYTNDQRDIFIFKCIQKDIKNLNFYFKNLDKEEQIKNSINRKSIVTVRA